MAGKGQPAKRKTDGKTTPRSRKPAAASGPKATVADDTTVAPSSDAAQPEGASSELVVPTLAAEEPPRPERHPLARMRDDTGGDVTAVSPETSGQGQPGIIEHFTTTATTSYDRGHGAATDIFASVREQIREQPVKAVLIAAGAGFLYGLISRR